MKSFLTLLWMGLTFSSQAGLGLGLYRGTDGDEQPCSVLVKEIVYREGVKSPFNEIVHAQIDRSDLTFDLRHRFDIQGVRISMPDHDLIDVKTGVNGHESLRVQHGHINGEGRVSSFVYVVNNSKAKLAKRVLCSGMELVED